MRGQAFARETAVKSVRNVYLPVRSSKNLSMRSSLAVNEVRSPTDPLSSSFHESKGTKTIEAFMACRPITFASERH